MPQVGIGEQELPVDQPELTPDQDQAEQSDPEIPQETLAPVTWLRIPLLRIDKSLWRLMVQIADQNPQPVPMFMGSDGQYAACTFIGDQAITGGISISDELPSWKGEFGVLTPSRYWVPLPSGNIKVFWERVSIEPVKTGVRIGAVKLSP